MDRLIEKARFHSDVALAIGEALDITLEARQFVTIPVLDARLSALDAKMQGRFAALEKLLADTKVWAAGLYGSLVIVLFGALAANHYWLVSREDQLIAQVEARSDRRFEQVDTHFQQVDAHFKQVDTHFEQVDARFQQVDARFQQVDARFEQVNVRFQQVEARLKHIDAEMEQIRALLSEPQRHR